MDIMMDSKLNPMFSRQEAYYRVIVWLYQNKYFAFSIHGKDLIISYVFLCILIKNALGFLSPTKA